MTAQGRFLFWVTGFLVVLLLVFLLRSVLLPFVAGFAIAYLLDPINDSLERCGLSRNWATSLLTSIFFLMVVGVGLVLVPVIYSQLLGFIEQIPAYVARLREATVPLVILLEKQLPGLDGPESLVSAAGNLVQNYAGTLGKALVHLMGGGLAVFNVVSLLLITPVVAFYLLRDWDRILRRLETLLPRNQREIILEQARAVDEVLAGFVRGQAVVSLSLGLIYGVLLSLIGLEFGLIIGLITGILTFIPYLGIVFGMAVAIVVAILQWGLDPIPLLFITGIFLIGQVAETALLQPRMLGSSVGLHPVWILFGVLAGGALFGFVGVLLAVPATAVAGVLVRFGIERYRESQIYLGDRS